MVNIIYIIIPLIILLLLVRLISLIYKLFNFLIKDFILVSLLSIIIYIIIDNNIFPRSLDLYDFYSNSLTALFDNLMNIVNINNLTNIINLENIRKYIY
jgi:hypothetical protein